MSEESKHTPVTAPPDVLEVTADHTPAKTPSHYSKSPTDDRWCDVVCPKVCPDNVVRVEFPLLDDYDALRFAGLLKQIYDAIWHVHGEGMHQLLKEGHQLRTRFWEDELPQRAPKTMSKEELHLIDTLF